MAAGDTGTIAGIRGTMRKVSAAALSVTGRTARFRQAVKVIATALDLDAGKFSVQLIAALALIAQSLGRDLAEADWWRLLDALLLVAAHPAS
jgi:hypothetical protein